MNIMDQARRLIVNADDFGQSPGVNAGIMHAHEHGIVTSASLMVRWPSAESAAAYARAHPLLSLGVHVDLGEWIFRAGSWEALYEVVPIDDHRLVSDEVRRQLERFHCLFGKQPTHIDSHQHVHRREPLRSVLKTFARELGVPLRSYSRRVRYCGAFYGQTEQGSPLPEQISMDGLIAIIRALPLGVTELGCHPALHADLQTMYRNERIREVEVLCDARVREAISVHSIQLCNFETAAAR